MFWKNRPGKNGPMVLPPANGELLLSNGEIHYLWWYIQGSIMNPHVRYQLRKNWGFCQRHAWGAILVEASFRHGHMHGPAIVYEDILGIAASAMDVKGPFINLRLPVSLRDRGPCLMCNMGLGPESRGAASPDLVTRGQDATELRVFARTTRAHWEKNVCGRCLGNEARPRCRRHLIEDASRGMVNRFSQHRDLIDYMFEQITLYARSFRWEFQGTETEENKAALISAVGWCSGWQLFLPIIGMEK